MLPLPLALSRVLDLTTSLAGAYATRLLADLGAEILLLEPVHGDASRALPPALRRHLQRNKFSCSLDVTESDGHDLARRLAAACLFVFADAGATALDYDSVAAVRPDVIYLTLPAAARPEVGIAAAGAALTALLHQRTTGQRQRIEVDSRRVAAGLAGTRIAAAAAGASSLTPDLPLSGRYACADGSLAIVVRSSDQVDALSKTVGRPDLASGDSEAKLRASVSQWAARRTVEAATQDLLAAGVPAQPIRSVINLVDDPHLRARGFFEPVAHADAGVRELENVPYHFSRTPAHIRLPAPRRGEHTDYVLRTLLGLSDAEVESLRARGVVA